MCFLALLPPLILEKFSNIINFYRILEHLRDSQNIQKFLQNIVKISTFFSKLWKKLNLLNKFLKNAIFPQNYENQKISTF